MRASGPEHRPLYIKTKDIDIYSGMRQYQLENVSGPEVDEEKRRASIALWQEEDQKNKGIKGKFMSLYHTVL